MNKNKRKQIEYEIRVSGQEYACAYIGHACESQLYAYAYFEYVYSCKEHAYAYTPETLTQKLRIEKLKK